MWSSGKGLLVSSDDWLSFFFSFDGVSVWFYNPTELNRIFCWQVDRFDDPWGYSWAYSCGRSLVLILDRSLTVALIVSTMLYTPHLLILSTSFKNCILRTIIYLPTNRPTEMSLISSEWSLHHIWSISDSVHQYPRQRPSFECVSLPEPKLYKLLSIAKKAPDRNTSPEILWVRFVRAIIISETDLKHMYLEPNPHRCRLAIDNDEQSSRFRIPILN